MGEVVFLNVGPGTWYTVNGVHLLDFIQQERIKVGPPEDVIL